MTRHSPPPPPTPTHSPRKHYVILWSALRCFNPVNYSEASSQWRRGKCVCVCVWGGWGQSLGTQIKLPIMQRNPWWIEKKQMYVFISFKPESHRGQCGGQRERERERERETMRVITLWGLIGLRGLLGWTVVMHLHLFIGSPRLIPSLTRAFQNKAHVASMLETLLCACVETAVDKDMSWISVLQN